MIPKIRSEYSPIFGWYFLQRALKIRKFSGGGRRTIELWLVCRPVYKGFVGRFWRDARLRPIVRIAFHSFRVAKPVYISRDWDSMSVGIQRVTLTFFYPRFSL